MRAAVFYAGTPLDMHHPDSQNAIRWLSEATNDLRSKYSLMETIERA